MPPIVEPQTAKAIARSRPTKTAFTVERVEGRIIAAPTPWSSRAAMSALPPPAKPASDAGDDEHDHADEEEPLPAVDVAHAADREQQRREHEGVDGVHPLGLRRVEVQVLDDDRKRDVDDGRVHDDERHAEGDGGERPPATRASTAVVGGGGAASGVMLSTFMSASYRHRCRETTRLPVTRSGRGAPCRGSTRPPWPSTTPARRAALLAAGAETCSRAAASTP